VSHSQLVSQPTYLYQPPLSYAVMETILSHNASQRSFQSSLFAIFAGVTVRLSSQKLLALDKQRTWIWPLSPVILLGDIRISSSDNDWSMVYDSRQYVGIVGISALK